MRYWPISLPGWAIESIYFWNEINQLIFNFFYCVFFTWNFHGERRISKVCLWFIHLEYIRKLPRLRAQVSSNVANDVCNRGADSNPTRMTNYVRKKNPKICPFSTSSLGIFTILHANSFVVTILWVGDAANRSETKRIRRRATNMINAKW